MDFATIDEMTVNGQSVEELRLDGQLVWKSHNFLVDENGDYLVDENGNRLVEESGNYPENKMSNTVGDPVYTSEV